MGFYICIVLMFVYVVFGGSCVMSVLMIFMIVIFIVIMLVLVGVVVGVDDVMGLFMMLMFFVGVVLLVVWLCWFGFFVENISGVMVFGFKIGVGVMVVVG